MEQQGSVRSAELAGLLYPADKLMLEKDISLFLESAAELHLSRKIRSLIVPHAGYAYAGGVSARAYRQISTSLYKTVILLAPALNEQFDHFSIYPAIHPLSFTGCLS